MLILMIFQILILFESLNKDTRIMRLDMHLMGYLAQSINSSLNNPDREDVRSTIESDGQLYSVITKNGSVHVEPLHKTRDEWNGTIEHCTDFGKSEGWDLNNKRIELIEKEFWMRSHE